MNSDQPIKDEAGSLHADIQDDAIRLRIIAMQFAVESPGSCLVAEELVKRANTVYNYLLTGHVVAPKTSVNHIN